MHGERADTFYRKIGQKLHLTVVHIVTLSILSYLLGVRCQLSPRPSPFPLRCPMLSLWLTVMLTLPLFPVSLCACVPVVCSRPRVRTSPLPGAIPFRPLCRARVTQQLCHALLPCPNHDRLPPVTESDHIPPDIPPTSPL